MKKLNRIILASLAVLSLGLSTVSPLVKADIYTYDEVAKEFKEDIQRARQGETPVPSLPDLSGNPVWGSQEDPWQSKGCKHFHFRKGVTYVDAKRGLSFKLKREDNYGDGYIYNFIIKSKYAASPEYGENDNQAGESHSTSVSIEPDENTEAKKLPEVDDEKVQAFHFENGINYVDKKNKISIFFTAFAGNNFDNGNTYNFTFYSVKKFISDYEESQEIIIPPAHKKEEERKESYKVIDKINTSSTGVW